MLYAARTLQKAFRLGALFERRKDWLSAAEIRGELDLSKKESDNLIDALFEVGSLKRNVVFPDDPKRGERRRAVYAPPADFASPLFQAAGLEFAS